VRIWQHILKRACEKETREGLLGENLERIESAATPFSSLFKKEENERGLERGKGELLTRPGASPRFKKEGGSERGLIQRDLKGGDYSTFCTSRLGLRKKDVKEKTRRGSTKTQAAPGYAQEPRRRLEKSRGNRGNSCLREKSKKFLNRGGLTSASREDAGQPTLFPQGRLKLTTRSLQRGKRERKGKKGLMNR